MRIESAVLLAPLTTFSIGGPARYFAEAKSDSDIREALAFAREHALRIFPLGAGSNLLVPDAGVDGLVLRIQLNDTVMSDDGDSVTLTVGAGVMWDAVVDRAVERSLYGIENLAGIPGTLGGAVVQNIGAYGAELASTFLYADVINTDTGETARITRADAQFGYRTSVFKEHPELIILRAALTLKKDAPLALSYADLARAKESGVPLATPQEVASAVRAIRAQKFPSRSEGGTAGSFFKNPIITQEHAAQLLKRYPELPTFPQGNDMVKVPLAWILDRVLSLKGYTKGPVRLYEKQPLVIVSSEGARATDVDALAQEIAERVHEATNIRIEREVETFSAR